MYVGRSVGMYECVIFTPIYCILVAQIVRHCAVIHRTMGRKLCDPETLHNSMSKILLI